MDFLDDRKGLPCKISGKAASGEASSTMGDYRAKLEDCVRDNKPRKESPGTFFLDTASGQADVSARVVVVGCGDGGAYWSQEENGAYCLRAPTDMGIHV